MKSYTDKRKTVTNNPYDNLLVGCQTLLAPQDQQGRKNKRNSWQNKQFYFMMYS